MNLIDFFLNNKFTVKEDGGFENNSTIKGNIRDLKKYFKTEDILEMAKNYKGNHYKFIINLAIESNKLDLAFDLALLNQDSKLSKQIYAKIQEAKIAKFKAEEIKTEEIKAEEMKVEEVKTEESEIEKINQLRKIKTKIIPIEQLYHEYEKMKRDFDRLNFHDKKINMLEDELKLLNNDPLTNIMNIFFPFSDDYHMKFFHNNEEENNDDEEKKK